MIPEEKRDGTVLTLSDLMWEPDADWRKSAACSGVESDTFFPASEEETAANSARAICAECPVQEACLQYALSTNQTAGVWGGLDAGERRRMRRRLRDRERRKAS
jgi:WhiB family redox-sensing transcriptional regulator